MSKLNHEEDLDLLLSLQDRVLETPPASPSHSPGYLSDDGLPKQRGKVDMSVFRDAVQDCLDYDLEAAKKAFTSDSKNSRNDNAEVEKFSGLRIRNQVVSSVELSNRFSDIRFVRLPAIKNLLNGDTLSGCWATVGVLTEKGITRMSSTGKAYAIWKMSCLNDKTITVFLFGDAYQRNCNETVGTVFALFNSGVRKDNSENGFSLSVYSACNILKMGISVDYSVCKGKTKMGRPARKSLIKGEEYIVPTINRQHRINILLQGQNSKEGGNLKTAFRDHLRSEGIYVVNPSADRTKTPKSVVPLKLLSVEGLKKALSQASQTTTNMYSQGIRFLTEITGKSGETEAMTNSDKRSLSSVRKDHREKPCKEPDAKRIKVERQALGGKTNRIGEKMIELEFVSSDEEL